MAPLLFLNQEFATYEEFLKIKEEYEKKNFVKWVIDQSSTIENANKKLQLQGSTQLYDSELNYQNVKFVCKHGGRKRIGTGRGIRPIQSTYKLECPAYLHLIAKSKTRLRVVGLVEEHLGHELTEENYTVLPEHRKLTPQAQEKAQLLMKGGVKPCVVRSLLRDINPGFLTARDLANLRSKWKTQENGNMTEEEKLLKTLDDISEQDPGCRISIGKCEENNLKFLFVQTSRMRENVVKYGKVIILDHTYKINKHRMPVTVFMVTDGYGSGRSAGYAFVANELLLTVTEVVKAFKDSLPEDVAARVKTVVIDKDPSEIGAIKEVFPAAQVQLCKFHTSKSLRERYVKECSDVKEIIEKLKNTDSEDEFQEYVIKLKEVASEKFFSYFEVNWLHCPEAWANKDKKFSTNLGNFTTNRVENHNSKMKMMLSSHSSLAEAIAKLLELVQNKEEDVVYRYTVENLKETYMTKNSSPEANQILKDLTRYAAKLQIWELTTVSSSEEMAYYNAGDQSCNCLHRWSYELPCRHMYQRRSELGLPVYSFTEIDKMWHKNGGTQSFPSAGTRSTCEVRILPSHTPKTATERYRVAFQTLKELASMMSESGARQFSSRMQTMKDILKIWANGKEVAVLEIVDGPITLMTDQPQTQLNNVMLDEETDPKIGDKADDLTAPQLSANAADIEIINLMAESDSDMNSGLEQSNTEDITSIDEALVVEKVDIVDTQMGDKASELTATELPACGMIKIVDGKITETIKHSSAKDVTINSNKFDDNLPTSNINLSCLLEDESERTLAELVDLIESQTSQECQNSSGGEMLSEATLTSNKADDMSFLTPKSSPLVEENGPNCRCGVPSVRRTSRNSPNKQFWGCPNYFSIRNCNFHRFTKAIGTGTLSDALQGLRIPPTVKTKGRPQGLGKTSQRKFYEAKRSASLKVPDGAHISPFQMKSIQQKERQQKGYSIDDKDVTRNGNGTYSVKSQSKAEVYKVTKDACTCPDPVTPCKHMWKIRKLEEAADAHQTIEVQVMVHSDAHGGEEKAPKCCSCGREAGSHSCLVCGKVVHAIPPCSMAAPTSEEGFGQKRICTPCNSTEPNNQGNSRKRFLDEDLDVILPMNIIPEQATPPKHSRSGRTIVRKKIFSPSDK